MPTTRHIYIFSFVFYLCVITKLLKCATVLSICLWLKHLLVLALNYLLSLALNNSYSHWIIYFNWHEQSIILHNVTDLSVWNNASFKYMKVTFLEALASTRSYALRFNDRHANIDGVVSRLFAPLILPYREGRRGCYIAKLCVTDVQRCSLTVRCSVKGEDRHRDNNCMGLHCSFSSY